MRVGAVVTLVVDDGVGSVLSSFARMDPSKSESPAFNAALAWSNQCSPVRVHEQIYLF